MSLSAPIRRPTSDAGFTLVELTAALLVASMLILGVIELTRRYATTSVRMAETAHAIQDTRMTQAIFNELRRADPGSLQVSDNRIEARLAGDRIEVWIERRSDGTMRLQFRSRSLSRTVSTPQGARFHLDETDALRLETDNISPPIALVRPMRDTPFDCMYDVVVGDCR